MHIYTFRGANYSNRRVQVPRDLVGMQNYLVNSLGWETTTFNIGDGINTSVVVGSSSQNYSVMATYLVVTDDMNSILSRWFITESVYLRGEQYRLQLHRDVIADSYSLITNAQIFCERGYLPDTDDGIFAKEGNQYNQIKKESDTLPDLTRSAWILAYINKSHASDISLALHNDLIPDITVSDLTLWDYYQYTNKAGAQQEELKTSTNASLIFKWIFAQEAGLIETLFSRFPTRGFWTEINAITGILNPNPIYSETGAKSLWDALFNSAFNYEKFGGVGGNGITSNLDIPNVFLQYSKIIQQNFDENTAKQSIDSDFGFSSDSAYTMARNLNQKILYDSSSAKYYRILVDETNASESDVSLPSNGLTEFFCRSIIEDLSGYQNFRREGKDQRVEISGSNLSTAFSANLSYKSITIRLVDEGSLNGTIILQADHTHCEDAPYDIFAFPMSNVTYYTRNLFGSFDSKGGFGQSLMSALSNQATSIVYDVQIFPYCPIDSKQLRLGMVYLYDWDMAGNLSSKDFSELKDSDNNILARGMWARKSKFSGTLITPMSRIQSAPIYPFGRTKEEIRAKGTKIVSETYMWRLCSPDYSAIFEFNAAQMDGYGDLHADFVCKPYNPSIRVYPEFKRLYGKEFQDARGLICKSSFSISRTESAWQNYELQNKNYEKIFNRQIQNLEITQDVAREEQVVKAVTGGIVSTVQAAASAGVAGGPVMALLAGGVTAAANVAGALEDWKLQERLRNEQMEYNRDMHMLQMGSIKAQPDTLTSVDVLDPYFKIFPVIEVYRASQIEINALQDQITWSGMKIGRYGQLNTFINPEGTTYVKGKLIRLDGIDEDAHYMNAINDELSIGLYIEGGYIE